jgi:tetratricopeptide (TPR) repeat protein
VQRRYEEALDKLEASLAVARDIGDAHMECVVLCNLGMAHDSLARFDEASGCFEAALAIARAMGDRRREGQFLSHVGLLHAHRAKFDDARHCLDASEALLQAVSDRMSLGILLCGRAETEHLAGVHEAARAALRAADIIATEVRAGPDSELGLTLARVRNLLRGE